MASKARGAANAVATTLDLGGAVAAAGGGAKGLYRDGDTKACVLGGGGGAPPQPGGTALTLALAAPS